MADDQIAIPTKRRRISDLNSSSQIVPCDECIRIQLKLIKAEGYTEFLTSKSSKQAEHIKQQAIQIKLLEKNIKQLVKENQELKDKINQKANIVSVKFSLSSNF